MYVFVCVFGSIQQRKSRTKVKRESDRGGGGEGKKTDRSLSSMQRKSYPIARDYICSGFCYRVSDFCS